MRSPFFASPLRYPGGKATFARLLAEVLRRNEVDNCVYAEPFAGGAGAALSLLYAEQVSRILINDLDPQMAAFWRSILTDTDAFLSLLRGTRPSLREWERQRAIYVDHKKHSDLETGFATFFLNRCNRSGIIVNGGPIGGFSQCGKWGVDARWSPDALAGRIQRIAAYKRRIEFFQMEAQAFLSDVVLPRSDGNMFVYLDPPYFEKGALLYMNSYQPRDHERLANYLKRIRRFRWMLSYDNSPKIRKMYKGLTHRSIHLTYTAHGRSRGKEVLIHRRELDVPRNLSHWIGGRSTQA
ncbi:MAG: DNA adenine methylase [Nannocystaceae bacterium]